MGTYTLAKNEECGFPVEVMDGVRFITLKVILQCDSDDEREPWQWHHAETVEWTAPPPSRSRKAVVLR